MKRFTRLSALCCAAALALAGCSSGDDKQKGSDSLTTPKTFAAGSFSGEPIKVGVVAAIEKAAFANPEPYIRSAALAATDSINERGGIQGRQLEVIVCDDEGDPNKAAECGRTFVQEKVVAVLGSHTVNAPSYAPVIAKAGIPDIGSSPLALNDYQDLNSYPLTSGGLGMFIGAVINAKMAGQKSIYIVGQSLSGGEGQSRLISGVAKKVGLEFKGYGGLPPDSSDLSPAVRAAMKSGTDTVLMALDKVLTRQFMVASQSLGAEYTLAHAVEAITPKTISGAPGAAEGMLLSSPFPPFQAEGEAFPALERFNDEMDAREEAGDQHADEENRQTVFSTWLAFQVLEELAKGIEGDITAATVKDAVAKAKDLDLGIGVPWSPAERNNPNFKALINTNAYFSTVKDGEIVLKNPEPVNVMGD
jgi:branched-chain amino acid transport system substrate-binding protein